MGKLIKYQFTEKLSSFTDTVYTVYEICHNLVLRRIIKIKLGFKKSNRLSPSDTKYILYKSNQVGSEIKTIHTVRLARNFT